MDARERIIKAFNHEEADKVPRFELTVDNYDVCNHFKEEY